MRFSTHRSMHWTSFITWFLLATEIWTDHIIQPDRPNHLYHPLSFQQSFQLYPASPTSPLRRSKRQSTNPDFTWKPTKTPKFITAKVEKHPEPVLRVYPPDNLFRSGRSRELQPQFPFEQGQGQIQGQGQAQGRSLGRRVIYYATLPDVPRHPTTNISPLDNRYVHYPMVVANQQRSYSPSKVGKDFVTKVSSSLIGIRPGKDSVNSTPTFTIIDANTTPYSGSFVGPSPYNRVHVDYNMVGHVGDKPNFNYIPSYYNPTNPKNQYEFISPQYIKAQYPPASQYPPPLSHYSVTPYYGGNVDKTQQYHHQLSQYQQYQHQSSPYLYGNDVSKLPSPYHSPPYPSRHTRFPTDRYPIPSPLSQYNLAPSLPATSPPNNLNLSPAHQDFNDHDLSSFNKPSLGLDGPSPTLSSGLEFNGNLGSSLDHGGLDLDEHSLGNFGSPLKDKFPDYNSLGNKYFDFNSFNNELPPFKNDLKDTFKLDKEPFKNPFSQVSDWLTNNLSSLDSDDLNNPNRDVQIKGSAHSVVVDSQMVNQNVTQTVKDSNNTIITPFTTSNGTSLMQQEERTMNR